MEVLDTSVANVALPHISGNLGVSTDNGTWILTSYLVTNAIVLPMGAWASSVMGRKRFFMLCIVIFTVSSFLCGLAVSFPMLVFSRIIQGAGGGGLPNRHFSHGSILWGAAGLGRGEVPLKRLGICFAMASAGAPKGSSPI